MIATVTLNPAIDRTLLVENFSVNAVNRVRQVQHAAGGKGVNAARVVHFLGEDTIAIGVAGGSTGRELTSILAEEGIRHDFVWSMGTTRVNTKIVDTAGGTCTDINEPGPHLGVEVLEQLKATLQGYAASEILIVSGNVQEDIPKTVYRDIINGWRGKVILDASGSLLKEGLKAAPWMIKPNIAEFSEILGHQPKDVGEIVAECRKLNATGIEMVCVSMGADGLILVGGGEAAMAKPPAVKALSTVGAGDAVVGSLAVSFVRREPFRDALRRACALSAASVMLPGTGVPDKELVDRIDRQVEVIPL